MGEGVVLAASEESFAKAKPDLADVVANTPLVVHEVWRNLNGGASAPPGRVIAWSRPPSGRPRGTGRVPTGLRVWLPWAEVLARHVVSDGCRVLAMGDVAVFAHTGDDRFTRTDNSASRGVPDHWRWPDTPAAAARVGWV